MRNEVTARDRVHIKACYDDKGCTVETGNPGDRCKELDLRLDQVEREAVEKARQRLLNMHMDTMLTHGGDVGAGLALAIVELSKMLEPWRDAPNPPSPHEDCLSPDAAGKCPHGITETAEKAEQRAQHVNRIRDANAETLERLADQ